MAYFVISYDLVKEKSGFDYGPLTTELKGLDAVRTELSVWYLDTANTAQEVYNHLKPFVDSDDRLMVVEFSKKPAWGNALKGTRDWVDARF